VAALPTSLTALQGACMMADHNMGCCCASLTPDCCPHNRQCILTHKLLLLLLLHV
jgi:hypothetical protein